MARIGRQLQHFDQVDLQSIHANFSSDYKHRYTLSICFQDSIYDRDRSKKMLVILKNPSSADEKKADATIRKVETYVYKNFEDIRYLEILNIFAYRATDAKDVSLALKEKGYDWVVGSENNFYFGKLISEADYVICAWGGPSGINSSLYEQRTGEVKKLLKASPIKKVFEVCGAQNTKEPLHGLMWGYDYKLKDFSDTII